MMSDNEAIGRVLAGDVASFRVLVERYERRLFGFIRRFLPAADCADVAQDVLLSAYRNLASYRADAGRFSTWLLAMARNRCLNVLAKRGPVVLSALAAPEPIDPRTPDSALDEAEFFARLDAALAALPLGQRTAFILAELQGLSLAEISGIEAVSVGTVKSRLSRARAKLREQWARADERAQA